MDLTVREIKIQEAAAEEQKDLKELSELQLTWVGGGIAELVGH